MKIVQFFMDHYLQIAGATLITAALRLYENDWEVSLLFLSSGAFLAHVGYQDAIRKAEAEAVAAILEGFAKLGAFQRGMFNIDDDQIQNIIAKQKGG